MPDREKVTLQVKSKDPKDEDDGMPPKDFNSPGEMPDDDEKKKDKKDKDAVELSDEDELLKETLETAVSRITEANTTDGVAALALNTLKTEIRSATSSMTSVPKPLKFLRAHYPALKDTLGVWSGKKDKVTVALLADIVSVLAMTMGAEGERECLKFKMMGNRRELGEWGHEFVRALSGEISQEFTARVTAEPPTATDDLLKMVDDIVPFQMEHNSEAEAVDLLAEVNELPRLVSTKGLVHKDNYARVCLYLITFADYVLEWEELQVIMSTAYTLYLGREAYPDALRVAMKLGDMDKMRECMRTSKKKDPLVHKQLAMILGQHRVFSYEDEEDEDDDEEVNALRYNSTMWEHFQTLARELNVEEVKTPEDVYKSHLSETGSLRREAAQVESARQNLASTFVNAFVNAGFQKDALMTVEGAKWLFKNKDHGMLSAAASLGMILMWNVDEGMSQIDKFLYSGDENIKAGSLLALGMVNCGVRDEVDPAFGMLPEYLEGEQPDNVKMAASLGLGLAYAGSPKEELAEVLTPLVQDKSDKVTMDTVAMAGLALGLVYAGTADTDVATTLVERLMEASDAELDQAVTRNLCVGLGFIFLGKQEGAEAMLEVIKTIEHDIAKFAAVVVETCAYAGSGNVLQIQKLLHICAEQLGGDKDKTAEEGEDPAAPNPAAGVDPAADEAAAEAEEEKKKNKYSMHQSAAVLGIALITMGESVGSKMAERTFQHLLQYGDLAVRRAVPLAMALSHISDPDYALIDVLSKLTHDQDMDTTMSAILALGLMCSGTNNSRVAGLLRQLATFYAKEANPLFMVRIAQGLLHAGKGLVTLSPFHSDRMLLSLPAVAGLLTVLYSSFDLKSSILGKHHFLLYTLATAFRPRMLLAVDEDLKPVPVNVRVGQAVETVGQAGRPKTITGFQTHSTPVLLGHGDRAELASDEYEALTSVLEGVVIMRKKKKKSGEKKKDETPSKAKKKVEAK